MTFWIGLSTFRTILIPTPRNWKFHGGLLFLTNSSLNKTEIILPDENPWLAQISANSKTSKAQSKWHRWPRWPRYKTSTLIVSLVSRSFKHSMPMRTNCGRAAPRNDIGSGIIDRRLVLSFPLSMKYLQRYHKMAKWRNGHRQQNLITELETERCAAFNVSTESFCQGEVARYCKPNLPILRKQK